MNKATAARLINLIQPAISAAIKPEGFEAVVLPGVHAIGMLVPKVVIQPTKRQTVIDAEKTEFIKHAAAFDIRPSDYGRVVVYNGQKHRVVSLCPRRKGRMVGDHHFPVTSVANGIRFMLPASVLDQLKPPKDGGPPSGRVMVDFRCPYCDRPVVGKEEVAHRDRKPSPASCQHCGRGPFVLAWDYDDPIPEMRSWSFEEPPKPRKKRATTQAAPAKRRPPARSSKRRNKVTTRGGRAA